MEEHSWVSSEGLAGAGHGLGGAVVGWPGIPMLVVDEKRLSRNGVRVVVMMGKDAGGPV